MLGRRFLIIECAKLVEGAGAPDSAASTVHSFVPELARQMRIRTVRAKRLFGIESVACRGSAREGSRGRLSSVVNTFLQFKILCGSHLALSRNWRWRHSLSSVSVSELGAIGICADSFKPGIVPVSGGRCSAATPACAPKQISRGPETNKVMPISRKFIGFLSFKLGIRHERY